MTPAKSVLLDSAQTLGSDSTSYLQYCLARPISAWKLCMITLHFFTSPLFPETLLAK